MVANPLGRMSDQFGPAPPLARLKASSTGVVGASALFTTAVAAEETGPAEPEPLVPVTVTTIVDPTSAGASWYVDDVAAMFPQFRPPLSQRCH